MASVRITPEDSKTSSTAHNDRSLSEIFYRRLQAIIAAEHDLSATNQLDPKFNLIVYLREGTSFKKASDDHTKEVLTRYSIKEIAQYVIAILQDPKNSKDGIPLAEQIKTVCITQASLYSEQEILNVLECGLHLCHLNREKQQTTATNINKLEHLLNSLIREPQNRTLKRFGFLGLALVFGLVATGLLAISGVLIGATLGACTTALLATLPYVGSYLAAITASLQSLLLGALGLIPTAITGSVCVYGLLAARKQKATLQADNTLREIALKGQQMKQAMEPK